jgi:hypothetical protein
MEECVNITEVSRRDIIDYLISREKPFSGRLGELEFLVGHLPTPVVM